MGKKRELISDKKYDYKVVYFEACRFLEIAEEYNEKYGNLGFSNGYLVPILVNVSFSCELFLKSILRLENNMIEVHDLKKMFDNISSEASKTIREKINDDNFDKLIEKTKLYFNYWRYAYEKTFYGDVELGFMFKLAEALKSTIDERAQIK